MNQGEEAAKRVLSHLEKVIDAELIAQIIRNAFNHIEGVSLLYKILIRQ